MTYLSWDEFVKRMEETYTPDEVVEVLGLSTTDLVEAFKEGVEETLPHFDRVL